MKNAALILSIGVLLTACGGVGVNGEHYTGRQGSQAWFATASPQTIAAYYEQQCSAYGHKPGSAGMTKCVQESALVGRQSADVRAANYNAAMLGASAALLSQNNQPVIQPPPPPQRTYCTTRYDAFLKQYQTYCN